MNKQNQAIDISVIVPVYNVSEYLEECLDSLLVQGDVRLEVIMIDDGSTDDSGQIADRYAEEHAHFHCYHIPNGGLGHARNYGVQFATGKYIFFIDSDDYLQEKVLETMFRRAEKDGSELTICNVTRFDAKGEHRSKMFNYVFFNLGPVTHITRQPQLLYDSTSWNKLILRSFYDKNAFQFPERILYEDIPVTIPMHFLTKQVSVVPEIGYMWRLRDGASSSITQKTDSLVNLRDRIRILQMQDQFFAESVKDPALEMAKQIKVLDWDLFLFIKACLIVSRDQVPKIMEHINAYIDEAIDPSAFSGLDPFKQEIYQCVRTKNVDRLIALEQYRENKYKLIPLKEEQGKLLADLPKELFHLPVYDLTQDRLRIAPDTRMDKMSVSQSAITLTAHVMRERFNMPKDAQKMQAYLYNSAENQKILLPTESADGAYVTEELGHVTDPDTGRTDRYNYDGTAVKITIPLQQLSADPSFNGRYLLQIAFENRFERGCVYLEKLAPGIKSKYRNTAQIYGDTIVHLGFQVKNRFVIEADRSPVFADSVSFSETDVQCKVNHEDAELLIRNEEDGSVIPMEKAAAGTYRIARSILNERVRYHLLAQTGAGMVPVYSREKASQINGSGTAHAVLNSLRNHAIHFRLLSEIAEAARPAHFGKALRLKITRAGDPDHLKKITSARLFVPDPIAQRKNYLASASCKVRGSKAITRFKVDFTDNELVKDFYQSARDVQVEYLSTDGQSEDVPVYTSQSFMRKYDQKNLKIECYRSAFGTLRLQFKQVWDAAENSKNKREKLVQEKYPEYCKEPIVPNRIIFEAMWGDKYSCNPRALYEYINENHPEYECIWSFNDQRTPVNGNAKRVRKGSLEYWHTLATAKYLINNVNFENGYQKREGQIEVQTMHGTPLKTMGLDVVQELKSEEERELFLRRSSRWNYLIVQGKFMEDHAWPIYHFEKEILRTGYPRTDILYRGDPEKKEKLRSMIGIPSDKKVILYAPTWRRRKRFDLEMDLQKMRAALSDDYVLLIRLHYLADVCDDIPQEDPFIMDLTSYDRIEDLYLITDILITDYSSVMFDFALTGRPMLFYTYDMEEYASKLRGIYVDFRKESPGPLLYSTEEIIEEIRQIDQFDEKYKDRIEAFHEKFLTYEGGDSCKKVVETVFKEQ